MNSIENMLKGEGDTFIIAEIGINHNGDIGIAKKLIDVAVEAGCNAVKFQKRTIDVVYSKDELQRFRENPFGNTNGDLKRGLEFGLKEYKEIDLHAKDKNILWFASCWDEESVNFIDEFDTPCYKIASASLTDDNLLKKTCSTGKPVILSTGMSTMDQIRHAVDIIGDNGLVLLHCTSTYPSEINELNLDVIGELKKEFSCPIGYSGHESGVSPSVVAVTLGATVIERHITLKRSMWGSDHAASLEPQGLNRLVRDIRQVPVIRGDGIKIVYDGELSIIKKLRRI